jgi:hypothetical protein
MPPVRRTAAARRNGSPGSRPRSGDTEAIAKLLASRFGYEVVLQCDRTATLAGLRTLLHEDLPQRVPAAGARGEPAAVLLRRPRRGRGQCRARRPSRLSRPQDAKPAVNTHLPMEEVREALAHLPCRHLLVVLDCCFSGSFHWEGRRPVHVPGGYSTRNATGTGYAIPPVGCSHRPRMTSTPLTSPTGAGGRSAVIRRSPLLCSMVSLGQPIAFQRAATGSSHSPSCMPISATG